MYHFKSMGNAVDHSYLLDSMQSKYVLSFLLGQGSCGEVRLAYNKVTFWLINVNKSWKTLIRIIFTAYMQKICHKANYQRKRYIISNV